ncbi:MAG: CoB--CoM heterodisulfide reductase iron-sulfur subunit B family protein [Candidatus Hodarchaeota archaeon]
MIPDEFALYLGCRIPIKNLEFEKASRLILKDLGINLHDMTGVGCCPNPVGISSINLETWLALGARNISIAEKMNKDIITFCAGCFETLRTVNHTLKGSPELKAKVKEILQKTGYDYNGTIKIYHLAEVLFSEENLKKIKEKVTKKLDFLTFSSHYGCHLIRPSEHMQFDDPERPLSIDRILNVLGVKSVDSAEKMTCCGYCARLHPEIGQTLSERKMLELNALKVDGLVGVCPACLNQYEMSQRKYNKSLSDEERLNIPVFYLSELIALAFGYSPEELRLKSKMIKPIEIIEKISS